MLERRICECCGAVYEFERKNRKPQKYCSDCKIIMKTGQQWRRQKKEKKNCEISICRAVQLAAAAGLSYGEAVARGVIREE